MKGHEQGVFSHGWCQVGAESRAPSACCQLDELVSRDLVSLGRPRMQFHERFRCRVAQASNPSGLGARLIVRQRPSRREVERVFVAAILGGWLMRDVVKAGAAAGRGKPLREETGRPRMIEGGAGPEDAVLR